MQEVKWEVGRGKEVLRVVGKGSGERSLKIDGKKDGGDQKKR